VRANTLAIEGGRPVRAEFLPFGRPSITQDEIDEVVQTLRSGWIGSGKKVQTFEQMFAAFVGADRAVAVNSCTAALHLSLLAAGCGPGDEVITSDLTFVATANAIVHAGAEPVLADIDRTTLNVTAATIAPHIGPRTRAIVPVHFGGLPCELVEIYKLAANHGLTVIEDCAHAAGAEYRGQRLGSFDGFSCFSFYANKNLTTGEGGMVTTPHSEAGDQISMWRLHGLGLDAWERFNSPKLLPAWCVYPGFKYNLTDLAASIGLHQLRRLPEMLVVRESHASLLDAATSGWDGIRRQSRPSAGGDGRHALHLYVLLIEPGAFRVDRNQIVAALRAENIGAAIHYEPVHRHPYYRRRLGIEDRELPHSSSVGDTILSLPTSSSMTSRDVEDVIDATDKVLRAYRR
jgi:dTDP-4-amino-4,6-dideoxygalactose transaminase